MKDKNGFTLIETIIVIVLIGVIAGVVGSIVATGIKAYFQTDRRKEGLDQSRLAMERMVREIRGVRDNRSVCNANSTTFEFINTDGTQLRFILTGSNIQRIEVVSGNTYNLASNVQSLTITYYDVNNSAIGVPTAGCSPPVTTDIKRMSVDISVLIGNETVSMRSSIYPRNI